MVKHLPTHSHPPTPTHTTPQHQDPRQASDPAAMAAILAAVNEPTVAASSSSSPLNCPETAEALSELRVREQQWRGALRAAKEEARQAQKEVGV